MKITKLLFLFSFPYLLGGCIDAQIVAKPTNFKIKKGVNIGNWLSSSKLRGEERAKIFTTDDIDKLASYGFDHLRLPVSEDQMFTKEGEIDKEAMSLAHTIIRQCRKKHMRIIFDLHITRSHHFSVGENRLWSSKESQDSLVRMWKLFMKELEKYPEDFLAYELLNEPVAPKNEQWNDLSELLIKTIRSVNKRRVIVLGSNKWQAPPFIEKLELPQGDKNIILSFHFYEPTLLTHYGAKWHRRFGKLKMKNTMDYPGLLVNDDNYNSLSEEEKKLVEPYRKVFDLEFMRKRWEPAIKFAKKKGLKLYLGEFGCLPYNSNETRLRWLKDVVSLCKEYNIAYCLWEYNNVFGFAERGTGIIKNQEMLRILTE